MSYRRIIAKPTSKRSLDESIPTASLANLAIFQANLGALQLVVGDGAWMDQLSDVQLETIHRQLKLLTRHIPESRAISDSVALDVSLARHDDRDADMSIATDDTSISGSNTTSFIDADISLDMDNAITGTLATNRQGVTASSGQGHRQWRKADTSYDVQSERLHATENSRRHEDSERAMSLRQGVAIAPLNVRHRSTRDSMSEVDDEVEMRRSASRNRHGEDAGMPLRFHFSPRSPAFSQHDICSVQGDSVDLLSPPGSPSIHERFDDDSDIAHSSCRDHSSHTATSRPSNKRPLNDRETDSGTDVEEAMSSDAEVFVTVKRHRKFKVDRTRVAKPKVDRKRTDVQQSNQSKAMMAAHLETLMGYITHVGPIANRIEDNLSDIEAFSSELRAEVWLDILRIIDSAIEIYPALIKHRTGPGARAHSGFLLIVNYCWEYVYRVLAPLVAQRLPSHPVIDNKSVSNHLLAHDIISCRPGSWIRQTAGGKKGRPLSFVDLGGASTVRGDDLASKELSGPILRAVSLAIKLIERAEQWLQGAHVRVNRPAWADENQSFRSEFDLGSSLYPKHVIGSVDRIEVEIVEEIMARRRDHRASRGMIH